MLLRLAGALILNSALLGSCLSAVAPYVDPADFSSAIYFEPAQATIDPSQISQLEYVAEVLKNHPTLGVFVKGHADITEGSEIECQIISDRRAQLVYDWLAAHGFESRVKGHKGFGNSQAIDFTDTEKQRRRNRRVELVIS